MPKKRKNGHPQGIFREIFVSATREMAPFEVVYVYQPENFEQKQLGTIFGIIKICDSSPESSFVANLLASVMRKEYFSKPSRPVYDSFEASLRKANLALAELARQGSVKWIGKICFAGGVIEKNNLHFSKLGTTSILLLRGGMLADIGAGLDSESAETDSHPLKTFSDISSGKVENGDCLVFTTSDLLEIFSLEEIRQNATRFSREEFPDILSASLMANSELSGTIVVNMVPEEDVPAEIKKVEKHIPYRFEQKPATSAVNYAEKKIFRPHDISKFNALVPHANAKEPTKKDNRLFVSESDEIIPKKSFSEKIAPIADKALAGTRSGFLFVWKYFSSIARRIEWRRMFVASAHFVSISVRKIRELVFRRKNNTMVVASAAAVLIIISVSVYIFSGKNSSNVEDSQTAVPSEQSNAAAVTPSGPNAKNIENISQLASLSPDARELVFMNDTIYSLTADKSILKINLASGEVEKIDCELAVGKFLQAAAMPDLASIFILTADKKIISFTPVNKIFQENTISFPDGLSAVDLQTYLTYIYILDANANQVYRYPRAEGGFGEGQNWLKTGSDIKNANGFAINEDLFIASKNQITPYLQGKNDDKISFENPGVPLVIDKIYSEPDLSNIYVLDNKNHRILSYAKDGKIVAQYFSESISGTTDLVVDEKTKLIYLQKSDSVSKFSIE